MLRQCSQQNERAKVENIDTIYDRNDIVMQWCTNLHSTAPAIAGAQPLGLVMAPIANGCQLVDQALHFLWPLLWNGWKITAFANKASFRTNCFLSYYFTFVVKCDSSNVARATKSGACAAAGPAHRAHDKALI